MFLWQCKVEAALIIREEIFVMWRMTSLKLPILGIKNYGLRAFFVIFKVRQYVLYIILKE